MDPKKRYDLRIILLYCAAITAVICAVILLFFRNSVFTDAINLLISVLEPFLYGFVIAYILRPACLTIERFLHNLFTGKRKSAAGQQEREGKPSGAVRAISVTLSILFMFAVITLLLVAVLPEMINSISSLVEQIGPAIDRFQEWLAGLDQSDMSHELVENINNVVQTFSDWVKNFLSTDLLPTLQTTLTGLTSSFMSILEVLKNFGLGCIVAIYLLADWERFVARAKLLAYGLLPVDAANWLRDELKLVNTMFGGFISGKLICSLIVGLICFIFMSITRMPYAMLISVLIGTTNIIPFFGPYIGAIPSVFMLLTVSPAICFVFLIFLIILQQFDGNILSPKILGNKLGISGFWILFSILFFGALFGIIGMLIGVPMFAVLYDLLKRFISRKLQGKGQSAMLEQYQNEYHAAPEKSASNTVRKNTRKKKK